MIKNTKKNPVAKSSAIELDETQLDAISGGPDYYNKFDGVDGESKQSRANVPVESFSLNFEEIKVR